jgi:hypothetical protein
LLQSLSPQRNATQQTRSEEGEEEEYHTRRRRDQDFEEEQQRQQQQIVGVMSVIDILTRVDVLCKKYEKYDLDKQRGAADSMSGNDQFLRLYTVLEADIEAAIQVLVLFFPRSCLPNASFPVTVCILAVRGLRFCCSERFYDSRQSCTTSFCL